MPPDGNISSTAQILEASRSAIALIEGKSADDLRNDSNLTHALEQQIEIVGEASMRTSAEFRAAHPEIDWRQIKLAGRKITHSLARMNADDLFKFCDTDLRRMIPLLEKILDVA